MSPTTTYWLCSNCNSAFSTAMAGVCPICERAMKPRVRPRSSRSGQVASPQVLAREVNVKPVEFHETRAGYPLGVGAPMGRAFNWGAVLKRDPCVYCGGRVNSIDHIVPMDRSAPVPAFGKQTWLNHIGACRECNGRKGSTLLLFYLLEIAFERELVGRPLSLAPAA